MSKAGPVVPAPAVSILMVTRGRYASLDACLASIDAQENAPDFELLVASHADPGIAAVVHRRFPDAKVILVDGVFPGGARNELIEKATGELLLFLDDDIIVKADLLARLTEVASRHPRASVFGGPNLTPTGSSQFQVVQGAVLGSIVGSGPVRHRYGAHPAGVANERYFTLCNLAVRRPVMLPFDPSLLCAEENAVLSELHRLGVEMRYDPDMVVFHERRGDLTGFCRQMFKYGRGRGQVIRRGPVRGTLPHSLPVFLVAYLVGLPGLSVAFGWPALGPMAVYALFVLAGAVKVGASLRRLWSIPLAATLLVALHLSYGTGVVWGIIRRPPVPRRMTLLSNEPAVVTGTESLAIESA